LLILDLTEGTSGGSSAFDSMERKVLQQGFFAFLWRETAKLPGDCDVTYSWRRD